MRYAVGLVLWLGVVAMGHAQGARGAYAGGGLGTLSYGGGAGAHALSDDTKAYRLLAGYRFNDRYALEGGFGFTGDIPQQTFRTSIVRGIAMLPLSKVNLYGGGGYYDASFNHSMQLTVGDFEIPGRTIDPSDLEIPGYVFDEGDDFDRSQTGVTLVGGILFDLPRISVRAEYEWFDTDGPLEASSLSLLALFRF